MESQTLFYEVDISPGTYQKGRHTTITVEEAFCILNDKSLNTTASIPFRPHGGEVFLFKAEGPFQRNDWKADGHKWHNQGTAKLPRSNPKIAKTYFYVKNFRGGAKDFKKDVFTLVDDSCRVLIHYMGIEPPFEPSPRGNAKRLAQDFFPTTPLVLTTLTDTIKTEDLPHKIFKEEVSISMDDDATSVCRNLKQVYNVQVGVSQDWPSSRDTTANIHELASNSPGFIHNITTYPDLVVVCGQAQMFDELSEVLHMSSRSQLLSYTSFQLGKFFISPLFFHHMAFEGNPVMLAGALLHEGKLQQHHEAFFNVIASKVNGLWNVPIATDNESSIIKALKSCTSMKRVGCHRHLMDSVRNWVENHKEAMEEQFDYVGEVTEILAASTYQQFSKMLAEKLETWSTPFLDYFRSFILPRVSEYGAWAVRDVYDVDEEIPVTVYESQAFTSVLNSLRDWVNVPADVILFSLQMLQKYYYNELRRGRCGISSYPLKEAFHHLKIRPEQMNLQVTSAPDKIVESIKTKTLIVDERPEVTPVSNSIRHTQAREIIMNDAISFCAKLGVFVVQGASRETVKLFPYETCSCPAIRTCVHSLAVKMAIGLDVEAENYV
ncbi:uncharacterized protein LOC117506533 [Thalassophryne amazonica]|uniref:uncharacterized protein LOC117506533 n=1 Tax=Thalassophryne amazonica TaxID=390379 RepID=UPI001471C96E|nr:uncharacterized protein LOC117506533 [Thalassophryne amazonica]XP_034021925.1 uncharacterized protein LOC117506533 [Thalassophryne amazonica]